MDGCRESAFYVTIEKSYAKYLMECSLQPILKKGRDVIE